MAVAADDLVHGSRRICQRVAASEDFRVARHVVLYAARRGEVDPGHLGPLMATRSGCRSYYPRVEDGGLVFRRATASDLSPGRFGIPEPPPDAAQLDPEAGRVLFLVPGLGFDRFGRRLGSGQGYYDRALPRYVDARRMGLALEEFVLDRLPTDPWDVPMHAIVTPLNVFVVDPGGANSGDWPWR
jgi:5-formyltetrahydrofolate cyclo-ligase